MVSLLRAFVLAAVTYRIPVEIAMGRLSDTLLRPISLTGYWAAQDAASKALHLVAAVFELSIFFALFRPPFFVSTSVQAWAGFTLTTLGAMVLYFQMSYMLGVMGFWSGQSWGPFFLFETTLEFCAGSYFPIDVLPMALQKFLALLPFPYLIFHPLSIYLGRETGPAILKTLFMQGAWMIILGISSAFLWRKGLRRYAAEGR
jgi:ABC-2 type transport system permease protein